MKRTLFAKIMILVLCLSLLFCGCAKSGNSGGDEKKSGGSSNKSQSAGEKVMDAFGNTLGSIFTDGASTDVISDALKAGKITVTWSDQLENVLYIDSDKMLLADELKLNMDGVELDAEVYLSEKDLVVALPGILDDAYGVNFDTLLKDLKGSYIWEMMGTDYDSAMAEIEASMGDVTAMMDQLEPLMEGLGTTIDSLLDCVDSSVTSGTVTVDGQDVDATIITYSFDQDDVVDMGNILLDYMEDVCDVMADMGGEVGDYTEEIQGFKDELEAMLEEFEMDFSLTININPDTNTIMTMDGELTVNYDGQEESMYIDGYFGIDAATSDRYYVKLTATEDGEVMDLMSVELTREVNGSTTTFDLSVESDGYDLFTASLQYNSSNSAYVLSLDDDAMVVTGTYKLTDDYFEFSVATIEEYGYETDIDVMIKIEAISPNQIPKAPSYTNILKMSESDWMDLAEEIQNMYG